METIINNEICVHDPSEELMLWMRDNLVVTNPLYTQMKMLGKEDTIKYKHIPDKLKLYHISRDGAFHLPFGVLKAIWKYIKQGEFKTEFNSNGCNSICNDTASVAFYDYQQQAIDAMVEAKGGVLVSPAGSGKTYMGTEIIRRVGKKTLWLCHTGDLLRQAANDMQFLYPNIKIGLTTEGELNIGEDVTISTIQTLVNIDPDLYKDKFDVVICDESAHVCGSPTQMKMFQKILSTIPARYKYGLTATPSRSDGMIKAMYYYIGVSNDGKDEPTYKVPKEKVKTIVAKHEKVEINNGYSDYDLYNIYDSSGMLVYNELIDSLSNNEERTNKIIENIVKCNQEGRKQVVLTLRVEHCEQIVKKLQEKGVNAVLCVGKTSAKKREQILKQLIPWDVIVATYSLLKEGVSVKQLDTLHMVTPVKDKAMVVQCAGRIERYLDGKKQPIVYDYVDVDIPYCEKAFTARRRALKTRF